MSMTMTHRRRAPRRCTARELRHLTRLLSLAWLVTGCSPTLDTGDPTRDEERHHRDAATRLVDAGVAPVDLARTSPDATQLAVDATVVQAGALTITGALTLDRSDVTLGGTVDGTITYTNTGGAPIVVAAAVIAGRPPGSTHAGGPYDDFAPTAAATTLAPGASLTVAASRTFASTDPTGTWESYGTWRDDGGAWHDGPSVWFTVSAASSGGGSDAGMGGGSDGATSGTPPMAPGGYYVAGNGIYDAGGQRHLLHGVDRPSLEWSPTGTALSASDYQLMASWHARVVRLALDQDYWLSGAALYSPGYAATVDQQIAWAHTAGMDVILDLHWSDRGDLSDTAPGQQLMADLNSIQFWQEVAARYRSDGRVLFELYNEPHDIPWSVWQSGGTTSEGWQAAGMQQLYDAVRSTGAENLVLVGGNSWSSDLSQVPSHRIAGHNIVYAAHPYDWAGDQQADWPTLWGDLAATDPVILTEFGDSPQTLPACSSTYYSELIAFADAHQVSWTSWAWFPGANVCTFPSIIGDWSATPTPMGQVVQSALLGYPW